MIDIVIDSDAADILQLHLNVDNFNYNKAFQKVNLKERVHGCNYAEKND